ncbi:MAG: transcription termination factor Rho, partial [Phycisphaerae bacterium]|nr:transcription termination factor Rho [Phycisphaerae bacterium]
QLSEGGTEQQPDQLPGGPRKRRRRGRRRRRGDAGKNGGANEQADVEANSTSPIGSPVSSPTGAPTSRAPQIPKSADGDDAEDDDTDDEVGSGTPSAPVPTFIVSGIVDVATQGGKIVTNVDGRIRQLGDGLIDAESDPYITPDAIARFGLRPSQRITADVAVRKPRRRRANNRQPRPIVERVTEIEGLPPEVYAARKPFADLTALDPAPRLNLEHKNCPPACRLIDLFCPIGFGTRGLIVAPPKAGKTILLQNIAFGIKCNYPEVELIALLIDERPEEVTDFKRNVPAHVLASSNDQDLDRHLSLGILAIERAKRMVEAGKDVVVLLDSLTRLGRAFNNSKRYGSSGKIMSGGLDSRALEVPKQLFGAARRAEEGGSLTIIATCLVDTGSRADQIIFEEFKGTGNMELILDRTISDRRLFPAINLAASGTRKEHLLMSERELKTVTALRRRLHSVPPAAQIEQLLAALQRFETNEKLVSG